jgi:hypothetical protein
MQLELLLASIPPKLEKWCHKLMYALACVFYIM